MMRLFAVAILSALIFAPILHGVLPHDHAPSHHHGGTSVVWASLHQAATHEDKALLALLFAVFIAVLTFVSVRIISTVALFETRQLRGPTNLLLSDFLTRGLLPSRKFR